MKKLVVLSGAGVSAESGLKTFREMGGLWEEHDVYDVASPQGWAADQDLVLTFYNDRRKQLLNVHPNKAHKILADLESQFDVQIITQNVDNLHERAGSTKVLHLHGELLKSRSTLDPSLVYDMIGWELKAGDTCEKGSQLRPHIVWFGEEVEKIPEAAELVKQADILLIVGTSLNVYPAAGLIDFVPATAEIYLIDPNEVAPIRRKFNFIRKSATEGIDSFKAMISSN